MAINPETVESFPSMVIELPRSEFLQKIQDIILPANEWLAVCLIITESLNKLNIDGSEKKRS